MQRQMHRYEAACYHMSYGPHKPVLWLRSGDTLVVRTLDAGGRDERGRRVSLRRLCQGPGELRSAANPLVGPFGVEEAQPGDALAIHIEQIRITRSTAWSAFLPHFGCFTDEVPGRLMQLLPPVRERRCLWRLDLRRMQATLRMPRSRIRMATIPLHPFIGSIGVAPRWGRVELSLTPGEYGGNMDCPETSAGSTLILPVFVAGGLLSLGDVHAAQGDGEICGVALETTAEVRLRIERLPKARIEWPRLYNNDYIVTIGCARPLLEAFKIAHREMLGWLVRDYGFHRDDALQLLSQVGRTRIGNVCDPNYCVAAKFPRRLLPPSPAGGKK